jgi:hypothetical protein
MKKQKRLLTQQTTVKSQDKRETNVIIFILEVNP